MARAGKLAAGFFVGACITQQGLTIMAETKLDAPRPDKAVDKPKVENKDDHVAHIAVLAQSLTSVTPSGAETVRDKILMHVAAIQDPASHNERVAAEKKAEDEIEAQRAKDRAANKQPVPEKAKA